MQRPSSESAQNLVATSLDEPPTIPGAAAAHPASPTTRSEEAGVTRNGQTSRRPRGRARNLLTSRRTIAILVTTILLLIYPGYSLNFSKDFWLALGVALAAALAFALFYQFSTEDAAIETMKEEIGEALKPLLEQDRRMNQTLREMKEELDAHVQGAVKKVVDSNQRLAQFLPRDAYDRSELPLGIFNNDIQEMLKESKTYIFKGPTAKQVGARIRVRQKGGLVCKVYLFNPRNEDIIRSHALNRYRGDEIQGQEVEDRIVGMCKQIKQEICMAIVALYDLPVREQIEIFLVDEIMNYRIELVDQGVFVSYYEPGISTKYPLTLYYEKSNPYYGFYEYECNRLSVAIPTKHRIKFTGNSGKDIKRLLKRVIGQGQDVSDEMLKQWRAENKKTYQNIRNMLPPNAVEDEDDFA